MYLAVVLDENSRKKLTRKLPFFITRDWTNYCHHMTICMGSNSKGKYNWEIGEEVSLRVVSIGHSDLACAAMVELPEGKKIKNKIPHVTMAVDIDNGGKPVMSNKIKEWVGPVKDPKGNDIILTGVVTLCG